jgi:hypothetical protein
VAKNHTKTLDNLVNYRLNIIDTDFRLGKTTLFEHFYKIFAVVKHAIQPCDIFLDHTGALWLTSLNLSDVMRFVGAPNDGPK